MTGTERYQCPQDSEMEICATGRIKKTQIEHCRLSKPAPSPAVLDPWLGFSCHEMVWGDVTWAELEICT